MAKELAQDFGYPKDKVWAALPAALESVKTVSYTHLTLPTIYSV